MKVICHYNDPRNIPSNFPRDFDYGLEIGKEYIVMGIVLYTNSNCLYYLVDESGRPGWFPHQLFRMSNNSLPSSWFVRINSNKENSDINSIWGFDELCNDEIFYDQLMERNTRAMRIYFDRKKAIEVEL